MKKPYKIRTYLTSLSMLLLFSFASCQNGYLGKKPDKSLLVPATPTDFQSLMDNFMVFNQSPGLTVISADEALIPDVILESFSSPIEKNAYLWEKDIYEGQAILDWNVSYKQVFYSNIVLEGLTANPVKGSVDSRNTTEGEALFWRSFAFYNLVTLFSKHYDKTSSANDLGIPLRLVSDVNAKVGRATVQQVYDQVLKDLKQAENLLPATAPYQSRPVKAAANALLARIYLNIGDNDNALNYASAALKLHSTLLNYNELDATSDSPFPSSPAVNNPEVILYDHLNSYQMFLSSNLTVSPELYQLYDSKDLRKTIFYSGDDPNYFKGRYTGFSLELFGGLATDELYLIRAECFARKGNAQDALADLNTLLVTRWKTGTFQAMTTANTPDILSSVLTERRKELAFRGLRWDDLKRLNKDSRFAKTLAKSYGGKAYQLDPSDKRYVLPISPDEIKGSGIEQNDR
ncbi:RagB/SusD family nutrient uptake outer membrane protein [Mucilaginibacter sp. SJ]|uniref:RagB/SusD family nutrient uptake outer membrane protein n=1 Tax=Mucilaginibacter sp. SJ TaxID=3029053 RepID=UPI0023A9A0C0|nr:RagB/SusD family nutrient uptake outer membrane protein [Mucilaginibacter sp. SJ]WEA00729.1 RagB/SusD family nutrient uptake outer membrane protein [Mucilaginibacter sp. SJ]